MQPPIAPEKVVRRRAAQSRAVPLGCSQHRAQPPERPEMAVGTALLWLSAALLALPGVCGDCPQPPRFSFAEPPGPTNSSYPVGTVLRYRCRPGYTGDRNKLPSVTCLPNSTWASDPDFCIGKSCGQPEIPNGNFHFSTNLQFGATINFTCKAGYRLVGKPTAQCILSGSDVVWDAVPYCESKWTFSALCPSSKLLLHTSPSAPPLGLQLLFCHLATKKIRVGSEGASAIRTSG